MNLPSAIRASSAGGRHFAINITSGPTTMQIAIHKKAISQRFLESGFPSVGREQQGSITANIQHRHLTFKQKSKEWVNICYHEQKLVFANQGLKYHKPRLESELRSPVVVGLHRTRTCWEVLLDIALEDDVARSIDDGSDWFVNGDVDKSVDKGRDISVGGDVDVDFGGKAAPVR